MVLERVIMVAGGGSTSCHQTVPMVTDDAIRDIIFCELIFNWSSRIFRSALFGPICHTSAPFPLLIGASWLRQKFLKRRTLKTSSRPIQS